MGGRRPDAAQPCRGVQGRGQRSERPRSHRTDLLRAGLRLDRGRRPARTLPLVGPVHPASSGDRGRQDGNPRAGRARGPVLHDASARRRRGAHHRATARHRRGLDALRPRDGRHHRPSQHPAALGSRRGRPRDLAPPGGRRPEHHRVGRRRSPGDPRQPRRRDRRRRDHRPHLGHRRGRPPLHRGSRVRQPATQVQDRHHRAPEPGRLARDQRRRLRRLGAPWARTRLRFVGRRGAEHHPPTRRTARRLRERGPRTRATTATAACATGRG